MSENETKKAPTKAELEQTNKELLEKLAKLEASKKDVNENHGRMIKGQKDVFHDLFRLELANTQKNLSYTLDDPIWVPLEHKHFFHTVDSNGKPQSSCVASAGHMHKIYVEKDENGNLIAKCGNAYKHKRNKKTGKLIEIPVKFASGDEDVPDKIDEHTHDVTYLQSEVFKQRVFSKDALDMINMHENERAARLSNPCL